MSEFKYHADDTHRNNAYVKSMEDINSVVERGRANVPDNEELRSLLHDRMYIPDGQACKRTEASIRKTIDMYQ